MAKEQNMSGQRVRGLKSRPAREDGRRQFLVYLNPALIDRIKMAAINDGRFNYELVEEVLKNSIEQLEASSLAKAAARRKQDELTKRSGGEK